jgi:hypothetical protein
MNVGGLQKLQAHISSFRHLKQRGFPFFPQKTIFPIPVIQHELLCHNNDIHDKKEEKLILLIHDW